MIRSKITNFLYFILFFSLVPLSSIAQADSLFFDEEENIPSLKYEENAEIDDFIITEPDYEPMQTRRLDTAKLAKYLDERAFSYAKPKLKLKKAENMWLENFTKRLKSAFKRFFEGIGLGKNIGSVANALMYTLAFFALAIILWGLLKLRIKDIFWRHPQPLDNIDFSTIETNIEDANFGDLIQQALQKGDYRMCVRYMYLETLKLLHKNSWIDWKSYKTNYEYYAELQNTQHKNDFLEITRKFEYLFYGNHSLDIESYSHTKDFFLSFQQKIHKKN